MYTGTSSGESEKALQALLAVRSNVSSISLAQNLHPVFGSSCLLNVSRLTFFAHSQDIYRVELLLRQWW